MNREIEFRIWDKNELRWIESTEIIFTSNKFYFVEENIVLSQFTGIKDRNGKDIYEGDIIKYYDNYGTSYVGRVYYDNEYCGFNITCFYNKQYDYPSMAFSESHDDFEIIGNIYENHDLINKGIDNN